VVIDVVSDRGDEFFDIAEDAPAKAVLSEIPKEALYHVQPGRAGRREVHMKTRVALEPALHTIGLWVLELSQITCNSRSGGMV
jgi:hypothetical protein